MKRSILLYFITFLIISGCSKDKTHDVLKPSLTIEQDVYEYLNTDLLDTVPIQANIDWDVSFLADANWVTATKNGDNVDLVMAKNEGIDERVAKIKVASANNEVSQIIIIKQHGDTPTLLVEGKASDLDLRVDFPGESKTIKVTSNMQWTASSSASWCVVAQDANGINATVQPSTQSGPRTAVISVVAERPGNDKKITITQKGTVDIVVEKTALTFTREAQTQEVTVTSNQAWTVKTVTTPATTPSWLTAVQDGDKLKITAAENPLLERTGVVTVSVADVNINIAVKQSGYVLNSNELDRGVLTIIYNKMGGVGSGTGWDISKPLNPTTVGTAWPGVSIDGNNRVTIINLIGKTLSGDIPKEIRYLTELTQLLLTNNYNITGTIPPEMGELTKLSNFSASRSKITGSIPIEFAKLVNLSTLQIHTNLLSGNLPANVFSKLTKLNSLELKLNNLSGEIPADMKAHPKWTTGWNPAANLCPQNPGFGFTNCP